MKKFIIIVFVISVILTFVYGFASASISTDVYTFEKNIEIDENQNIVLDFKGYWIKVIGWDMDYVRVKSNLEPKNQQAFDLTSNSNRISINNPELISKNVVVYETWPWLPILQIKRYEDFYRDIYSIEYDIAVNVPKNATVEVLGRYIRTDGCTVSYVEGDEAELRNSKLTKDFKDDVNFLEVRNCKNFKSVVFTKIRLRNQR